MKNEIPPSTTIAPIAMMIAELPLNPLPLPAVAVVWIVGGAVVLVWVETDGWGNPGVSGFDGDWAPAADGRASAAPARSTGTIRTAALNIRPYASGCSIAGVLGASAYGCSSSTSSSWYTLSALTAQMSWCDPVRMLSTARIAVSIEWSELL